MGRDSIKPFLDFENKWTIVLGLTSNEGASDFQQLLVDGQPLYKHVIKACASWGTPENMMFVVGATKAEQLGEIRQLVPDHFLLVPGVGAQGGDLKAVCEQGLNKDIGLLINSSRAILYASSGADFAKRAGEEAAKVAAEMSIYF
jgi:orotidine-5'-phosphate decarboxylase